MASSTLSAMRPARDLRVFTWALVAALLAAVVAAAWAFGDRGASGPRTAFASAPDGNYLVLSRPGDDPTVDVVFVAPASDPGAAMPIASINHLEGYGLSGAVSPDGTRLAVVVADAGTPSHPGASLYAVNLLTGDVTRLAIEVDHLQSPVWASDGSGVAVTRSVAGDSLASDVSILFVPLDLSGETVVETHAQVLGAWVAGYDPQGRRVTIVIDGAGSRAFRDGAELLSLAPSITRDWSLSPDGAALAFIEASAQGYLPRVVALESGAVAAQSAAAGEALGTAWAPGGTAAFGLEPAGGVGAQSAGSGGFDIPKGYAPDGSASLVQHWTGSTFADPGAPTLQVVTASGRVDVPGSHDFLGWAQR